LAEVKYPITEAAAAWFPGRANNFTALKISSGLAPFIWVIVEPVYLSLSLIAHPEQGICSIL
jgi:hypothetical protein